MKQAILITAYKNIDFLSRIIDVFDSNYSFFIHLDAKKLYDDKDIESLNNNPKVKFLSKEYGVNWGSVDHLKAIILLANEAVKDNSIEYIHLITGQDFPIKSPQYISEYLELNKGLEFIDADALPSSKWKGGGLNRIKYYSLYEKFDGKGLGRFPIKLLLLLQKIFFVRRKLPASLPTIYGGNTYWTLSRGAIEYILAFLEKNPTTISRFEYTFCAEEILFHSILMNSSFKEKVSQNILRYIDWEYRDGTSPANLDESDYEKIIKTDAIFARKFDVNKSRILLNRIIEAYKKWD